MVVVLPNSWFRLDVDPGLLRLLASAKAQKHKGTCQEKERRQKSSVKTKPQRMRSDAYGTARPRSLLRISTCPHILYTTPRAQVLP